MKEQILEIMSQVFNLPKETLSENTSQKNCEEWDSLKHLNLVLALEEKFDISLEPEEIGIMTDFPSIIKFISEKTQ